MVFFNKSPNWRKQSTGKNPRFALVFLCFLAIFVSTLAFAAIAEAETRTLKLHFVHTGEKGEVTFKRNGQYIASGLKQANKILRDFRRNEPTKMDPKLLDLVWEVYQKSGSTGYVNVISGYRSPATNGMLRSRRRGVAKNSQHTLGKAMDFFLTDVKLSKLREAGLKMGVGGVGYYPTSGSPFVHLDTGNVRHWPRMSRQELARIFPDGKTLHVPTDGKPLPRYEQALAEYKSKGRTSNVTIASASETKKPGFFQMLAAKSREDQADDEADAPDPGLASKQSAEIKVANAATPETLAGGVEAPAPPTSITPDGQPVPASDIGTQQAASSQESPQTVPVPQFAPRLSATTQGEPVEVASLSQDPSQDELPQAQVPVPQRRPEFAVAATIPEQRPRSNEFAVAALTPDEILQLRKSAVPSDIVAASEPVSIAQAETASVNGELALVAPDGEPEGTSKIAAVDAAERLVSGATQPSPRLQATTLANSARSSGPSRQTLELALAATGENATDASRAIRDLIEAGNRKESRQAVTASVNKTGIAVPVPSPRKVLNNKFASANPAMPQEEPNKFGRYALAQSKAIGAVQDIRAPGYAMGSAGNEIVVAAFVNPGSQLNFSKFSTQANPRLPTLKIRKN